MAILPLILNNLITPILIISMVSLEQFIKNPAYYISAYGPILWSIYHVLLALIAYRLFKAEGESLWKIIGSLGNGRANVGIIVGLIVLSVVVFQFVEPQTMDLTYGQGSWSRFIDEYKKIPLALVLYCTVITSLTAGISEEIVWRGYIQTRLQYEFPNRAWAAIIIQAVLFGFWHGVSVHTAFTALFGLIFGLVYVKTRRLIPIMISHWLGDVIGFSAMYFII